MKRSRRIRSKRNNNVPDIPLTPLIDTALTLLIIFMVTTPMIHNAIKVDLPRGQSQEGGHDQQELIVTVDKKGTIFFNNKQVSIDSLGKSISDHVGKTNSNQGRSVWIKIDAGNSCDTLIGVIDNIKVVGGIKDVKVVTQKPTAKIS